MRKSKARRITLREAIDRVPHDWAYCLDSGRCPYFQLRTMTKSRFIRVAKKNRLLVPIWYEQSHQLEYCSFLKRYLGVQDDCKDCGINVYDETGGYGEQFTTRKRIASREYADYYKEMFPDEVELIDKIVEEDKLEYLCKEEN